jgi:hypothetical protein
MILRGVRAATPDRAFADEIGRSGRDNAGEIGVRNDKCPIGICRLPRLNRCERSARSRL